MDIESALKTIGDWISKETESRKYPKVELLELSESLKTLKVTIARQSVKSEGNWKELREDFMHNLRGCDTVTVSLNGVGSTDYSTEDIHNMIASLTDNQVVAKSAISEEVAEAIEWVKGMERSYNLDRATGFASSKHDEAAEHCRVLLTALASVSTLGEC